ncbi:hypothetical protein V8F20_000474 [Naviculisporaceae sp. PSN 640]
MTILVPLIAQALGRSPYEEEVWHYAGHPTPEENTNQYQQQYDQRGRPVNPATRRLNRDIIRAHNEVMLAIGVVEPEETAEEHRRKQESIKRHHAAQNKLAWKLSMANFVIEKALAWLVDGMRRQIMIYKNYAALRPDHLLLVTARSWKSYLLAGLPSFLLSNLYSYMSPSAMPVGSLMYVLESSPSQNPAANRISSLNALGIYMSLHLDIFSFLQRVGLNPTDTILPTWRFFVPGTSISPLPIPPLPSSLTVSSAIGWLGTSAVGLAPFAGFYIWKFWSGRITDVLRLVYHYGIPAPIKRPPQPLADVTPQYYPEGGGPPPGVMENDLPDGPLGTEAAAFSVGTVQPRRQSTVSGTGRAPGSGADDEFASDDDGENEMVRAAIISIEVGPAEPINSNNTTPGNNGDVLGEIRPHLEDTDRPYAPNYRTDMFTLLPSTIAANFLGLSTYRLISTPWEALTFSSIAWLYAARGHGPMGRLPGGAVWGLMNGAGLRGLFTPWRRWESTLVLESLFFNGVCWAGLGLIWILMRNKISDEEWQAREGQELQRRTSAERSREEQLRLERFLAEVRREQQEALAAVEEADRAAVERAAAERREFNMPMRRSEEEDIGNEF